MQKRNLKQKCLAWVLSLAVAVTFIPMTAGFAFAEDAKNLSTSKVTLSESDVVFDGNEHKPGVTSVVDAEGTTVDSSYYEVTYPGTWNKKKGEYELTQNAYTKVGTYDVLVTALDGNAGGYKGSVSAQIEIKDNVTSLAVYTQAGENGTRSAVKTFNKGDEWDAMAETNSFQYGYNGKVWTTSKYIPVEKLLSKAGLDTGKSLHDKDGLEIWSNSEPQKYAGLANYQFGILKGLAYTADGSLILDKFGGEYTIPAYLVLDTDDAYASPMMGVGYSGTDAENYPRGYYFCKPVSEVVLISMDINGLDIAVKDAGYTGKAAVPEVTVKDGDTVVPVTVKSDDVKIGAAKVTITAADDSAYYGTAEKTFNIVKGTQPMTVKAKTAKIKKSKLKKKARKLAAKKVMQVSGAQGTVTYSKISGSKKLKIAKKTGKVTVKKKTRKGTYKMRVKVSASGNANYKAGSQIVMLKIKVK